MAKQILKPISPENYIGAYLDDKAQLFDVIEEILMQIGPSTLLITSFSISEEFIRKMVTFKNRGLIVKADLIIDMKAALKISNLLPFSKNVFDTVKLSNNHSKVILFEAKNSVVSLITSQNQTRGNRYESGMVTTDKTVFENLKILYQKLENQARAL